MQIIKNYYKIFHCNSLQLAATGFSATPCNSLQLVATGLFATCCNSSCNELQGVAASCKSFNFPKLKYNNIYKKKYYLIVKTKIDLKFIFVIKINPL